MTDIIQNEELHIVEQVVKFLCERSQKPNDEFDILAIKLGSYGDQHVNGDWSLELKGSEAVYGLLSWLTVRNEVVIFSAKHDAAIAANLAKEFCEANNLPDPRDGWQNNLTHP